MTQKPLILISILLLLILSAVPISIYIHKFGIGLWKNHQDWAHLGSFFGGVLSPVFTFISTILLICTVYYSNKTLMISQRLSELQENQIIESRNALSIQTDHAKSQRFDSLFFNQLTMVKSALDSSRFEINGKEVNAHNALAEDFAKLVKERKSFDVLSYQPYLNNALESYDQLVKLVEAHCPHESEKDLYRDLVHYNISVHFRWWIGKSWELTHPEQTDHREFLEKHYGIIRL